MCPFEYFTGNGTDNPKDPLIDNPITPPKGMRCTNVSMWTDVYWVAETVDECKSTVITFKTFETKEVSTYAKAMEHVFSQV